MEMYIDSSDWVMIPNVYGMATYSDGGLMSTKPYTCGSNYILKMSNYSKVNGAISLMVCIGDLLINTEVFMRKMLV